MITIASLKKNIAKSFEWSLEIRLVKVGTFQIFLPYFHEDGDMIDIFVYNYGKKIIVTDFGKTMMRLSYYTNLDSPTKQKLLNSILASYFVKLENGKLILVVEKIEELFSYIMEFISVVTKVTNISYLKQERIKNLFYENFENFMVESLSKELNLEIKKDFYPDCDQKKEYVPSYAILQTKIPPLLFFPVLNDDRCKDVTMALLYYKTQSFKNNSIVIFNDFSDITPVNSWKLINLADRPFTNFDDGQSKMKEYISKLI